MVRRVGVCSWSLRPNSPKELVAGVKACGLRAVQIALAPFVRGGWDIGETRRALDEAGITVLSGMLSMQSEDYSTIETIAATGGVRPDDDWSANLNAATAAARVAAELRAKLVTFHAGFLPSDRGAPLRAVMLGRLRDIAGIFAERSIPVGLETGQESAETLLGVLEDLRCPAVGVNFDPANMILYGTGDPVAALDKLSAKVMQVHIKDAVRSRAPGTWGTEVPAGKGHVDWRRLFAVLNRKCPECELVIERESGSSRVADVKAARLLIASVAG